MIQSIYVGTLRLPHWPWVGEYNAYFPAGQEYRFGVGTFLRPVVRDAVGNGYCGFYGGAGGKRSYKHIKNSLSLGGISFWGAQCDKINGRYGGGGS